MNLPPLASAITGVIGGTPMVELHRLRKLLGLEGRLLVKLEYLNPGSSKKDRIALEMMQEAKLDPCQPVVELTSGNTGTGLAIVCKSMGHPFIAVMSRGNTIERARMMQALGAEVVLVDQAPGSVPNQVSGADLALVEKRARQLVIGRRAFRADQFHLEANVLAHERHTGPEIREQSQGAVDVFLDYAGTGGTFTGISRYLKSKQPATRCYLVEPATAAILAGRPVTNASHKIQGGGYGMAELPLLDRSLVTDYLQVTDGEVIAAARMVAVEEGIFAGFSTGAHLAAAIQLLRGRERGSTIAFLACDSGLKYLSTDLFPTQIGRE
ncbi:MAG: cysteine synthase family protein [Verrucomicrobiota bacterium]